MKTLRWTLAIAVVLFLGIGHIASLLAALGGRAFDHAVAMDQPAMRAVAALLFLASIALAFVPDRSEEENHSA